jgi:pyrimidine deaminase RibD-like protein
MARFGIFSHWRRAMMRIICISMLFSRKNSIWKDVSPKGAVSDFIAVFRDAGPNRWRIALAAAGCTALTFSLLTREEHRIPQRLPTITYINSWREGRSDAEIEAGNIANQKMKEKEAAEAARDAQETRDLYKALGRASGMDVDAIEAKAKADEATEAAAKKLVEVAPPPLLLPLRSNSLSGHDDQRWLAATARLAMRARPLCTPNPGVGAMIVRHGRVIAQGWTQIGGRPHAEAMALARAGSDARGATMYVTLEPCAHVSPRGPACADLVAASGLARVVVGCADPDPRTAGLGLERIRGAGITADLIVSAESAASLEGYLMQRRHNRPHVTLKLATSLDGCIALATGESQWITGPQARAHTHAMRARADAILVGGGTWRNDAPRRTAARTGRVQPRTLGPDPRHSNRWMASTVIT